MSSVERAMYYRVYPSPPPTVNRLTARQKAQLRRTTTKLTKVLGEAPQVVDELPSMIRCTSQPKKLQPSLSLASSRATGVRRARSATAARRVDPELYPLSSTLRPTSCDLPVHARRSSESPRRASRMSSRSLSSEFTFLSLDDSEDEDKNEKTGFVIVHPSPRPRASRPASIASSRSRDSLCDSLYEPAFRIPSATKMRREKLARVCKLLGEDVPVELVFPVDDHPYPEKKSNDVVMDIHATPPTPPPRAGVDEPEIDVPPPTPPKFEIKRKPVPALPTPDTHGPPVPPKPEQQPQPRWMTYRASRPNLETIVEQSPRASCSSSASASTADSECSLLTTTTSSSYRFTSSGCISTSECSSSPASSAVHETPASSPLFERVHGISSSMSSGIHRRREFAIYVPFHRRSCVNANASRMSCQAEFAKKQECDIVRGILDLRV